MYFVKVYLSIEGFDLFGTLTFHTENPRCSGHPPPIDQIQSACVRQPRCDRAIQFGVTWP